MKVSDYIVEYLVKKHIKGVFGYPGGMVTHLMDSLSKNPGVTAHLCYHEQAAAFAACGYGYLSGVPGVAYATSGPGATNLITGICNAYYDSLPAIFITGQVNTYESKGELRVRQKGFQETDIVDIVKSITKYAVKVIHAEDIKYSLDKAYYLCVNGRRGPVLLDIPMNIQRAEIDPALLRGFDPEKTTSSDYPTIKNILLHELSNASRPLILAGAGIKTTLRVKQFRRFAGMTGVPVVTSMPAFDILPYDNKQRIGFIGAYGHRQANFAVAKSDLIISIGSRLSGRQTGAKADTFGPHAQLVRMDIDAGEFDNRINDTEIQIHGDLTEFLDQAQDDAAFELGTRFAPWQHICDQLKDALAGLDDLLPNDLIRELSSMIEDGATITTDVGQNQVWVAQSFQNKSEQRVLFSGGHGAMGFSLPAAIGAHTATGGKVICFNGDGGLQMNIQELQYLATEKIPVKVIVINNHALGMIRHFQEMYFDSVYTQTVSGKGFSSPDFCRIAMAYNIPAAKVCTLEDLAEIGPLLNSDGPALIEVCIADSTYVYPKLALNRPIDDQDPLLDRTLYKKLMDM